MRTGTSVTIHASDSPARISPLRPWSPAIFPHSHVLISTAVPRL